MTLDRRINELLALLRARYPDWDSFDHAGFVNDETAYKRATAVKAQNWLNRAELDGLIEAGSFDLILERLIALSRDNNLLFRRVPSQGDTAVLHHPALDKPSFCTAVRNLLHGDRSSPARLQSFSDYCSSQELPNKWTLPTYLLFVVQPEREMFVKPHAASWFLKFMGVNQTVVAPPTAVMYAAILEQADKLQAALPSYGAADKIDVQSLIWVCYQESKKRTGRLNPKGQVDLDVPPTKPLVDAHYEVAPITAVLREPAASTLETATANQPDYPLPQFAAETGYAETELSQWAQAIERKGQAIFYGPPGTGKTFMAEKMAQHLIGGSDGFTELIQFHPAYAYEDFMQGIRPFTRHNAIHYEMVPGRFMQFCDQARQRNGRCVLIIDEINRANLSSVFGELMYLLEYRNRDIPLSGGGRFSIPPNVRILGTMNTADRSIALVDHALRRRFSFIHLPPDYDVLRRFHQGSGFNVDKLTAVLHRLNNQIGDPHYHVGHAFFLRPDLAAQIKAIWRMEMEPYLEEYFFDQPDRVEMFRWEKVKMINAE